MSEDRLERLMDAFHIAAQRLNIAPELIHNQVTGSALERQYTAARSALRSYLSEDTLSANEAAALLMAVDHSSYAGFRTETDAAKRKLYRAMNKEGASMKEPQ